MTEGVVGIRLDVNKRLKPYETMKNPGPNDWNVFNSLLAENQGLIDKVRATRAEITGMVNLALANCFRLTKE